VFGLGMPEMILFLVLVLAVIAVLRLVLRRR
jgi:hypothetical protein